jgi:hypothetical protein
MGVGRVVGNLWMDSSLESISLLPYQFSPFLRAWAKASYT